jgi:hypothetical protein
MKKFVSIVSSYLGHVGFYFLLVILVFSFIALAAASATFNLVLVWSALLFSALLGLSDGLYALKFLGSYLLKAFLHVIFATASFAISFIAVSGVIEAGSTAVVGVLLFAVLMVIITAIRCVFYYVGSKKENENKAYDYLYTSKN